MPPTSLSAPLRPLLRSPQKQRTQCLFQSPSNPLRTTTLPPSTTLPQTRSKSTTARHKKLLHIPAAPSLTNLINRPSSQRKLGDTVAPTHDHIVFNPPSSAPNVYHTPAKFLPKSDVRRQLFSHQSAAVNGGGGGDGGIAQTGTALSLPSAALPSLSGEQSQRQQQELPPPVRQPYEKQYHLTESQMAQIRKLRQTDPFRWTRVKLAEKFGCSQFFVSLVCKSGEAARAQEERIEEVKRRWGRKKVSSREDRGRRKELWGRDG
ncbi:hypothetical protein LTS18_013111 [Coniosporium uncinatum]|uniref:Uncharacterized protein n=1 Tax=Coniosporium uncinatum TaxID=93489 RepID=A0ACC3D9C5_9PEZI|nr:hypothetical protein LTS18_013111 [Coniosporium uncinatum]